MSTNGSPPADDVSAIALTVAVNEQVERILASREFAESKRLQSTWYDGSEAEVFLDYLG